MDVGHPRRAERFERLRYQHGLSCAAIARALDLSPTTVCRIQRGHKPRADTARRIAEHLGVDAAWLFFGDEESDAPHAACTMVAQDRDAA